MLRVDVTLPSCHLPIPVFKVPRTALVLLSNAKGPPLPILWAWERSASAVHQTQINKKNPLAVKRLVPKKCKKSMYINAFQFSIFGDAKECELVGLTLIIRY